MDPIFLSLNEIIVIHTNQLENYGGTAGIRDMGLLNSAIAMPLSGIGDTFFHKDLFEMAAAYLFYIVKNHPFVDGNKRVGAVAAIVFLEMNNVSIDADEDEFYHLVNNLAAGSQKMDKQVIAEFFRHNSVIRD